MCRSSSSGQRRTFALVRTGPETHTGSRHPGRLAGAKPRPPRLPQCSSQPDCEEDPGPSRPAQWVRGARAPNGVLLFHVRRLCVPTPSIVTCVISRGAVRAYAIARSQAPPGNALTRCSASPPPSHAGQASRGRRESRQSLPSSAFPGRAWEREGKSDVAKKEAWWGDALCRTGQFARKRRRGEGVPWKAAKLLTKKRPGHWP